jgi:hypothetical protein
MSSGDMGALPSPIEKQGYDPHPPPQTQINMYTHTVGEDDEIQLKV